MNAMKAGALAAACLWSACSRAPGREADRGYWSTSCVAADGRSLLAGGDHTALVDLVAGKVVERAPGMVHAVGCDASGGIVVGSSGAVQWPARTPVNPVPALGDVVLARDKRGAWISASRRMSGGRWSGPAIVSVTGGRTFQLLPSQFGAIGAARALPLPDTFAVRFGGLLGDGRLLLSAGWQPSRSGGQVEDVPWAFFALDLESGAVEPLTPPVASDAAVNMAWPQEIAATPDLGRLAVATHDGERITVRWFERGDANASVATTIPAPGSVNALAMSADGAFVAVASETRGRDAPAVVNVLDRGGRTIWSGTFRKNVAGLHVLPDGALVIATGEATAVKVALPEGSERWRAE